MTNVKACVTVRNRFQSSMKCIESLIKTTSMGKDVDIYIYDNRTDEDLPILNRFYMELLKQELICGVYFNNSRSHRNVYWDKSYVFQQFMNMISSSAHPDSEYAMIIDNDVMFHDGWLDACITALEDKNSKDRNIKVISPWNSNPKYETLERFRTNIKQLHIDKRECVGTPCWFSTVDYWNNIEIPPYGLKTAKPDDAWWWDVMRKRNEFIGVINGRFVTDITPAKGGSNYSARLTYVGEDYPHEN